MTRLQQAASLALFVSLVVTLGGCLEHEPRVAIEAGASGESGAARGLESKTFYLTMDLPTRDGSVVTWGLGLDLVGVADPPVVDGVTLQATDVQWVGGRVYASYNVRGDRFLGALQVIDAHSPDAPAIMAQAIYADTDLNRIRVAGTNIFVAGADAVDGGTLDFFSFRNGALSLDDWFALGSYSATFVAIDGYRAFTTIGDVGGGVAVMDIGRTDVTRTGFHALHDARWVGALGKDSFVAVSGSPAMVSVYEDIDGAAPRVRSVPVDGAAIGAPTWAQLHRDHLYLSSDDAGLLIYDLRDLTEVGRLPTTGTANGAALSSDGKLAFLANGEEGLLVVDVLDPAHPTVLAGIDVSDDAGSANAVSVKGNLLALADGLGGVKLLRYRRSVQGPANDCDGDGVPDGADPDDDDDGVLDDEDGAPCDPDVVCADDRADVVAAFVGDFYNLPCDHPDVEGGVTGVVRGTLPSDFDWFDERWYSFTAERDSLVISYGEDYFPVDDGLCGDPFYFAAHWYTTAVVSETGTYTVEMGSDDDSWLFVDGELVLDIGGIHPIIRESATIDLTAGAHAIDIWFAERHRVQSGLEFEVVGLPSETARVDFVQHVCLADGEDADGDGQDNADDVAPLEPAAAPRPGDSGDGGDAPSSGGGD